MIWYAWGKSILICPYNNDINKHIDGGSTTEITYFKTRYFLQYYNFQTNNFYELNIYIEHYTFT